MRYDQAYVWLIQQEREREAVELARRQQARAYARGRREIRGPRFGPLRRLVGGWLVSVGMWLIAPAACAPDGPVSS